MFVTDNTTASSSDTFLVDREDSSLSRSIEYITLIIKLAGLKIVMQKKQIGFPDELFPVMMFAMVPIETQSHLQS